MLKKYCIVCGRFVGVSGTEKNKGVTSTLCDDCRYLLKWRRIYRTRLKAVESEIKRRTHQARKAKMFREEDKK
jgi:hypothetical protein